MSTAPADREVKERRVAVAREMLHRGLTEGTAGNLSARLSGGRVAMTPSSMDYEAMGPDDLAVVDLDGNVLEGERAPTTEKALHLACLRDHDDVGAVIHCHALFATMFAVTRQPIPCVTEEFEVYVGGEVPVAASSATWSRSPSPRASAWARSTSSSASARRSASARGGR